MATKLKDMTVRMVALVDQGANQDAHITLVKRADPSTTESQMTEQEKAALAQEIADTKAALAAKEQELAALKRELGAPPDVSEARKAYADVQAELDAVRTDLKKQLEAASKELEESRAEVVKIKQTQRRERFVKFAHQHLSDLPGAAADDFAESLDKMEASLGQAAFDKLCQRLRSWNEIVKRTKLFEEIGKDGHAPAFGSAEGALHVLATERAAEKKLSYAVAYDQIMQEQPDLYKRYLAEKES